MTNPKEEIRIYLKTLINRFFYIKDLDDQLKTLKDWESSKRFEAIEVGYHFFGIVSYSFQRAILVELCMMLSKREQKSLIDFLAKSIEHAKSIEPQEYDLAEGRNKTILVEKYRLKVKEHLNQLDSNKDIIARIEAQRDKFLTHADAEYFNSPDDIYKKYPINVADIDKLLDTVSEILRSHYNHLFNTDLSFDYRTANGLDAVLIHARAFKRIWNDKRLAKLNKSIYSQDNYNETEPVFLNF